MKASGLPPKDSHSLFWTWFVDFTDYALEFFGIYAIPSGHLSASLEHRRGDVVYAPLLGECVTPAVYFWNKESLSTMCSAKQRRAEVLNRSCNVTPDRVFFYSAKWWVCFLRVGSARRPGEQGVKSARKCHQRQSWVEPCPPWKDPQGAAALSENHTST